MHTCALVHRSVAIRIGTAGGIARQPLALGLLCEVLLGYVHVVLIDLVLGHTFHAEYLNVEALASGNGILDNVEGLLVDLVHVHGKTCDCQKRARNKDG
jgi:hypothetical protein